MLLAIQDHTVLPSTRHKWTHPALTPARARYLIYLPRRDGRLSWLTWLVTYRDGLPAHRRSPIQVLTQQCMAESWTHNLLITSPTPLTTTPPSQVVCYCYVVSRTLCTSVLECYQTSRPIITTHSTCRFIPISRHQSDATLTSWSTDCYRPHSVSLHACRH